MSESVIADFVARFNSDRIKRSEPVKGRVILSEKRLVLAVKDTDKLTIPLSSIFDVAVGQVPEELDGFFHSTVTIAFQQHGNQFVATVEGEDDKIEKFSTVLFKALLNGTETTVKHPARVGGRVTDAKFVPARLALKPKVVTFNTNDGAVEVRLSQVTEFSRSKRDIGGTTRPVLEVRHMPSGESVMTMVAAESPRVMGLLGRYLRLEYSDLMAELRDIELSGDEKEVLVALYSGAGGEGMSLTTIIDKDPSNVTMLLNRLEEKDLVIDTESGTKLTPKGKAVVGRHLEDVNA